MNARSFRGRRVGGAAAVGVIAGLLSGLFGVGGGILIVPGLVFLLAMDQRRAHGTSLAAIVPIALAGVGGFVLDGAVDWPVAAAIVVGAVGGSLIGTTALRWIPQRGLRIAFIVFLLLTAARMVIATHEAAGRGELDPPMVLGLVLLGIASGTLAGLLGVGGGIVIVPVLVTLFLMPDAVAKGTSLLVIVPTALSGTWRNVRNGNADVRVAAVVGVAGVASAFVGSRIALDLDPTASGVLFAILLVLVAGRMTLMTLRERDARPAAQASR
ncbi:MAG TPA: sulfite exporter TauE/SafE family protein [Actinomycetota bacterium]|nr:sulfite exporter TauE/SafE family protein [Actinomycetota bacterium]